MGRMVNFYAKIRNELSLVVFKHYVLMVHCVEKNLFWRFFFLIFNGDDDDFFGDDNDDAFGEDNEEDSFGFDDEESEESNEAWDDEVTTDEEFKPLKDSSDFQHVESQGNVKKE